jgi:predicted RNA-binding protein
VTVGGASNVVKRETVVKVTRKTHLKRDANKLASMMEKSGMCFIAVDGKRGSWEAQGLAYMHELCQFIVMEAEWVMANERKKM